MSPFTDTFLNISPALDVMVEMMKEPKLLASAILSSTPFFFFQLFLFALIVVFFAGILFLVAKINSLERKKRKEASLRGIRLEKIRSQRWDIVESHMLSENPGEWKLAIMEADSMLEDLVKKLGYPGSTLGEMMKQIEKSDFTTLDDAWEAHKVRNYIAHQGSTYLLTKHQANRVIRLYEKVFREFEYI
jgi:hypothetical protein